MKKWPLLFSVIALIAMSGCKKDQSTSSVDSKTIVNQVFTAGMSGYSSAEGTKALQEALKSSIQINNSVDYTAQGAKGGTIHVIGSITGSFSFNDATNAFTGGVMSLGLTETINSFTFVYDGQTYTMSGAPNITLTGTFTLLADETFGTASSMQIGGGVKVVGPNYSQTINIQITINLNSNGSGGDVSGTVGGTSVNYTF